MPLTSDSEKTIPAQVHEALERNSGQRPFWATRELAAKDLGITVQRLKLLIAGSPELAARWSTDPQPTPPLTEADAFNEKRFHEILDKTEDRIVATFESMGLSPDEAQSAFNGLRIGHKRLHMQMQMSSNNLFVMQQKLATLGKRHFLRIEHLQAQIFNLPYDDENRGNLVLEEKSVNDMIVGTMSELNKTHRIFLEASKIEAQVQNRVNGKPKMAKPAFQEVGQGIEVEVPDDTRADQSAA